MILTVKTDTKNSEIGLFNEDQIDTHTWQAGTELSKDLLKKIEELLDSNNTKLADIKGIIVFRGPGSFTGLRIGITVANTLAYGLDIPVVGEGGDNWKLEGADRIKNGENEITVSPEYGAEAHITKPKK